MVAESQRAVFLSYASQDAEAARRICETLRVGGIEVWFDQSELRGGDAWDQLIRRQIRDCALFVPIISANTASRHEGYFRLEWDLADQRSHMIARDRAFIVPVCIDGTPDSGTDVPESIVRVQWTRLPAGHTPPAFLDRVSRLLSPEPARAPTEVQSPGIVAPETGAPRHSPTPSPRSRATLRMLLAAVAVIGVGYFVLNKFVLPKRPAASVEAAAPTTASAPAPSAIPEKSIAVLPFVDMSEKHDQEYFGDGMAEEILNLLVKIPELKVIGRTSSFQFKGKTDDLRAIGSALGAAYVVEGSVRRSGDHVRVTAQLIDTRDGAHRWSETYDRDASDVLKVQGEIAGSLVRALQLEVANPLVFQSRSSLRSSEAYDIYLRGLHAADKFDQRGFEEAVAAFRRTLELDPSFVPAAEALAMNLASLAEWHFVSPQAGYEEGRAAAEAALKLDSKSALAHAVLGYIHTEYDWDWTAAAREMNTAVGLAPNDPNVLILAATERLAVGPWADGVHYLDTASTVDPLDPGVYSVASLTYVRLSRIAEAETAIRRALEISPTLGWGHHWLGVILLLEGKTQESLSEMQKETAMGYRFGGLAVAYFALNRIRDADTVLARLETEGARDSAMRIAEVYAFRGKKDQSFNWLERAYAQKDASLYYIKGDPLLKNLEGDSRYKAFLRKLNLPE